MAVKTYRKTALVTAEQFLPAIGQIPKGVFSNGNGDPRKRYDCEWVLNTKEGQHYVRGGDYICTGPAGEQWNVAQEIFEATYEEATDPAPHAREQGSVAPVDVPAVEQEPVGYASEYGLRTLANKAHHYCLSVSKRAENEFTRLLYAHPPRSTIVVSPEAGEYRHALERIANASVVAWNVATATEALNTARAIAASALSGNSSTEETVGDAITAKGGDHG